MIPASEALQLPSAKLTDEEIDGVGKLMAEIETHVRKFMSFRGIDMEGKETRPNVLSAVNHRLVAAGYNAQWQLIVDKHDLNRAINVTRGFKLALAPKPDVYQDIVSAA